MGTTLIKLMILEEQWSNILKEMIAERKRIKGGYITITNVEGKFFYNEKVGSRTKGITRDVNRRDQLIRARYLDMKIAEVRRLRDSLRSIISKERKNQRTPEEAIISRFKDPQICKEQIFWNAKQRECNSMQSQNPYRREDLKIRTNNGIWVRSLSEQLIGNLYEEMGIPYQYEKKVTIDVTDIGDVKNAVHRNGRWYKTIYPDFTLILADGSEMTHEHFGMLEDEEYRAKAGNRIMELILSGYITEDRIIITSQLDAKNLSRFRSMLEERVLPRVYA